MPQIGRSCPSTLTAWSEGAWNQERQHAHPLCRDGEETADSGGSKTIPSISQNSYRGCSTTPRALSHQNTWSHSAAPRPWRGFSSPLASGAATRNAVNRLVSSSTINDTTSEFLFRFWSDMQLFNSRSQYCHMPFVNRGHRQNPKRRKPARSSRAAFSHFKRFIFTLRIPLALMFLHCGYKSISAKFTTTNALHGLSAENASIWLFNDAASVEIIQHRRHDD
jgi:hypothetical protein